ncbi:hypothetical protein [Halorientalis regularis]|jgi:hypothetical protein|uniref:GCN5-related N-acetyltransferase n=1 Tax=Halorientalis regularis TaxID=660518 RepID=A0A1G7JBP4_9EURY|nr:hypothetical protein [Halorientalis regularis]SDF22325.1 hypothetical protein SAMN05216218_104281 [Halorientalis regularis]
MGQRTLDGDDLSDLRAEYDRLVHERLPAAARDGEEWPIHADHCFARIVLDDLFEDEWYDHVDGRPAYEHLSAAELRGAIDTAHRLLDEGPSLATELNRNSLRWRDEL